MVDLAKRVYVNSSIWLSTYVRFNDWFRVIPLKFNEYIRASNQFVRRINNSEVKQIIRKIRGHILENSTDMDTFFNQKFIQIFQ